MTWTLDVMRAFRDAMNTAKAASAPTCKIGWPTAGFIEAGPYRPFVWFDVDRVEVNDGTTSHVLTVVTGVVLKEDPSVPAESELEQAITTYYTMRAALATAMEDKDSAFNAAFRGVADSLSPDQGIRPTDGDDFDGVSVIGERWAVTGVE